MCKFLGWTNNVQVESSTHQGMDAYSAANGVNRFAVFEMPWQNPGVSISRVPNMIDAGNGAYKSAFQPLQALQQVQDLANNDRVKSALDLLSVVECAWEDHNISVNEGISILQHAATTATGQTALVDQIGGALSVIAGLFGKKELKTVAPNAAKVLHK